VKYVAREALRVDANQRRHNFAVQPAHHEGHGFFDGISNTALESVDSKMAELAGEIGFGYSGKPQCGGICHAKTG
jgi:hypothetical protein